MILSSSDLLALNALYDYNRIPLWIFNDNKQLEQSFLAPLSPTLTNSLTTHIYNIAASFTHSNFDIKCFENEIYYQFSFQRSSKTYTLIGGPILLSYCYHITEMRSLSYARTIPASDLLTLTEILPVLSFSEFSGSLRLNMIQLTGFSLTTDEIRNFNNNDLKQNFNHGTLSNLFDLPQDKRAHTPYREEVAVLNCVKEGNLEKLQALYQALPETRYGKMSNNPLRQLFYGCIANTTLVTRYAIEGGLEEEAAFTLSDLYIKQMENCRTLYELSILNEKMAVDFTKRVAKIKSAIHPMHIRAISNCITYINKNLDTKLTLKTLADVVNLTPKYLSSLFRKETGQTLSSFIEERRIEKAKELLLYSSYSYSHISQYLMFNSQSYFIVVFKKRVGMTPREYRENSQYF